MSKLKEIIEEQFYLHTGICIQDLYKLLYQGEFGSGHIIQDKDSARLSFDKEYNKALPNPDEWVLEQIYSDVYRLNFGACKIENLDRNLLFKIVWESSKRKKGFITGLLKKWNEFKKINNKENYFPKQLVEDFELFIKSRNFPAIHHSSEYTIANKPAYRLVSIEKIENIYPFIIKFKKQ